MYRFKKAIYFSVFILYLLIACNKGKENSGVAGGNGSNTNANNSSNGNNGNQGNGSHGNNGGNNGLNGVSCGGIISENNNNSSGASNIIEVGIGLRAISGVDTNKPIDLCTVTIDQPYIHTGFAYIPVGNDTLYFWSGNNSSYVSCCTKGDTTSTDRFEFLADIQNGIDSMGNPKQYYVLKNLSRGYKISNADSSKSFLYSYSSIVCLKYNLYGNNLGGFNPTLEYIAFRVYDKVGYKYGWVKVSVLNNFQIDVYEFLINNYYNTPITIGTYTL